MPRHQTATVGFSIQASPNSLHPRKTLRFDLPASGRADLRVYDPVGRRIRTLVSGQVEGGRHRAEWNAWDEQGRRAASGVYLCQSIASGFGETTRVVLARQVARASGSRPRREEFPMRDAASPQRRRR